MRTHCRIAVLFLATAISALAQGSFPPPSAPSVPIMKTLTQVEPRRPISAAPFTISQSGSYYLTGNLSVASGNAITISANGVTLDLSGYAITSTDTGQTGTGIVLTSGLQDITITNGHIVSGATYDSVTGLFSGPGFVHGVIYLTVKPKNVLVSRLSVSGCLALGIFLGGDTSTVESCTVRTVGDIGIFASVIRGSVAAECGTTAILGDNVSDCSGEAIAAGGVAANFTAQNCFGSSGSGTGVSAATATNCYGLSDSGNGVSALTATNCYGASRIGGDGIRTEAATSCRGESISGRGIFANYTATNCHGISSSGRGLFTSVASNCYGQTATGDIGLLANIANTCRGWQTDNVGVALQADGIAVSCTAAQGTISSPSKWLGTP